VTAIFAMLSSKTTSTFRFNRFIRQPSEQLSIAVDNCSDARLAFLASWKNMQVPRFAFRVV
jgi:hypothetical protein